MNGTMRAAVFHGVEDLRVETLPIPACPPDGLLVKVHYCGICGSDVRNYHNGLRDGVREQIMGHEIAGEVVEAAPGLPFAVGDRVALAPDISCGTCWYCRHGLVNLCAHHEMLGTHLPGGYAQYLALPGRVIHHGFVEQIPDGMSYRHAAFAETCAAVIACQRRIDVSLGDTVVILGDGPVGCLHLEVARARGASRIILLGRDKLELAARFRPDHLICNDDPERVIPQVLELTGGRGADVAILALPVAAVQNEALQLVRKRGTVVIYGGVPKNRELSQLNSNLIHYNELTVTGAFSYPATGLSDALAALHAGAIHADMYLGEPVSLDRVREGIGQIETGAALKVLIDPWKA